MKKLYFIVALLAVVAGFSSREAAAQSYDAWFNFCQVGGQNVMTSNLPSSNRFQQTFPKCEVTVFLAGSPTKASIYSDSVGTVLSNPFTADSEGFFKFYATPGVHYDITISGSGIPFPRTYPDVIVGGGGSGCVPGGPSNFLILNSGSGCTNSPASYNFGTEKFIFPTNVVFSGSSSGTCINGLALDADNNLITTPCGGGGSPAPPTYSFQFNNNSAFGASTSILTDPSLMPIYTNALNFVPVNNAGVSVNPDSVFHMPVYLNSYASQVSSAADGFGGLFIQSNIDSGTSNYDSGDGDQNSAGINHALAYFESQNHAPGQGGGALETDWFNPSMGDAVGHVDWILSGGKSRGQDEGLEIFRAIYAFMNATMGGNVAISAPNAQGNVAMRLTNPGNFGYDNTQASGEQLDFLDVTKKWVSPGSVQLLKPWATNTSFIEVDLTSDSGVDTRYPTPSSMTTITAYVNHDIYQPNSVGATCPNVTDTGTKYPGGNAFIADRFGVNIFSYAPNQVSTSNPSNYCVTVASTAGLTPGTVVYITDNTFTREYTTVLTVPDGTHFTANMKQPKNIGAIVSWGGAVGSCFSSSNDDRPAHTMDSLQDTQNSIVRLCYPIVGNKAGNILIVDAAAGTPTILTLAYASNTPTVPLSISPVITGGVVTDISNNNSQSGASYVTSSILVAGATFILPPPVITYTHSSAGTDPVITFKLVDNSYVPNLVSGGTNVTGINIATTAANPFSIYPHTITYRATDPNCANQSCQTPALANVDIWAAQGYMLMEPLASSAWTNGDEGAAGMWAQRFSLTQIHQTGDPIVANSPSTGPMGRMYCSFAQSGQACTDFVNDAPSYWEIGTFAHNWMPNAANPREVSVKPGPLWETSGIYSGLVALDLPPTVSPLQDGGAGIGGTLIFVGCTANFLGGILDHPCLHGRYDQFNIVQIDMGGSSQFMDIIANPTTGAWTFEGTSFFAPNISTNALSLPTVTVGNHSVIGELLYSREDNGTPAVNLGLANLFSGDSFLCVNAGSDQCNQAIGGYLPTGSLGAKNLYATGSSNLNNLEVGRGTPINMPSIPVYHGTAGTTGWEYWLVIKNALGQIGGFGTGGEQFNFVANAAAVLDASHNVTITCPTALQNGLSGGDSYRVISQDQTGLTGFFDVGACPVGTTITDTGVSGGDVSIPSGPPLNNNAQVAAGTVAMAATHADIWWQSTNYTSTQIAGISQSNGVFSFDGTAHADGLGKFAGVNLKILTFSSLGSCSGGIAGAVKSISDSNTQVWGAAAAGGGAFYAVVTCNGTAWTVMGI